MVAHKQKSVCCRPPLSVLTAILHKRYQELHSASGERGGPGPSFRQHLASVEGQGELRDLQAHMEARLRDEQ